jgi:hypothetical protein
MAKVQRPKKKRTSALRESNMGIKYNYDQSNGAGEPSVFLACLTL